MQTQSATFVTTQLSSHNSTGVLGQYIVATMWMMMMMMMMGFAAGG